MTSEEVDVIVAFARAEERAKARSQIEIGEPEIARRQVVLARKILCQ